ncbi:hypothetical protein [Cupriavidus malaysiensis]|uniref:DUF1508 domain-containing protein n=1 Tax=Cupriavidus malaysiensis TaxID=367825 RepID=A0ABM6F5F7_9BURK|nr:hypothetical protein [Cupriavidus malaysiensis]AOZ06677.1 hypothetical protein BKK80_13290 [Cupriavidus malaysiensis]
MEFRYRGREILIHVRLVTSGHWDWSYVVRGHGHRQNAGELASSEAVAIDEALAAAKREVDQVAADGED